jgi:hypothetical protein
MSRRSTIRISYLLILLQVLLGLSMNCVRAADSAPGFLSGSAAAAGPVAHCGAMHAFTGTRHTALAQDAHALTHAHPCCTGHGHACACGSALAGPPMSISRLRTASIFAPDPMESPPAFVQPDELLRPPIA